MPKLSRKIGKIETKSGMSYRVRALKGGNPISRTFDNRQDAIAFNAEIDEYGIARAAKRLDVRRLRTPKMLMPTLGEYIEKRIAERGYSTNEYKRKFRCVIRDLDKLAHVPIDLVEKADMAGMIEQYIKGGLAPKTIYGKMKILSSTFNHAIENELVSRNPCKGLKFPAIPKTEMIVLEHDEFVAFISLLPRQHKLFVETLFMSGMRFGEITALSVKDFNPKDGTLSVTKSWNSEGELKPPKTSSSVRTIAVPLKLVEKLRKHCKEKSGDELLFTSSIGGKVCGETVRYHWRKTLKVMAGLLPIPDDVDPELARKLPILSIHKVTMRIHDARHTCATWLLCDNTPLHVVSAHLGHTSIEITVDVYGHVLPSSKEELVQSLSKVYENSYKNVI
jgi:integrase